MKNSKVGTQNELAYLQSLCRSFLNNAPTQNAIPSAIDGEILWRLIQEHKLQAVVAKVMKSQPVALPEPYKTKLQPRTRKVLMHKLYCIGEITRIQQAHEAQGIYIIPYKGLAIGSLFYKDINLRDFSDVDFALEEKHLQKSAKLMHDLGYIEGKEESNFDDIKKSRAYHIDYSWVKFNDKGNILCHAEIHWQSTNSALYCPDQFSDLDIKTELSALAGREIRLFSKVENMVYMVIHHGLVDNWFQLRHLVDLSVALRTFSTEELQGLLSKLKETKALYAFYYGIQLSKDILGEEIKTLEIPKLLYYNKLYSKVIKGELVGKWSENKAKLLYYLLMRDNNLDRMKALSQFCMYFLKEAKFKFASK